MKRSAKVITTLIPVTLVSLAILILGPPRLQASDLPDLTVGQIKVKSAQGYPGKCWIEVELKNIGRRGVSNTELSHGYVNFILGSSQNGYSLDYVNNKFHGSLDKAGGSVWVKPPAGQGEITPGKSWQLTVEIDSFHMIDESNENNNRKTVTLTCDALPDLAITRVYTKPAAQGGCEIWAEVKNVGKFEVPKEMFNRSTIRFHRGSNENGYSLNYLSHSTPLRGPGGTLQVKAPAGVSPFNGLARVTVKLFVPPTSDRTVWDANPSNNEKTVTLSCIKAKKLNEKFRPKTSPNLHKIPVQPR